MNDKRISFAPYPSDPRAEARERFGVRSRWSRNLRAPLALDVEKFPWPISAAEAMIRIDVIHIWPWSAVETMFEGARRPLPESAPLYLYDPYRRGGARTAPGNAAFDARLRARNAGRRSRARDKDLETLGSCAAARKQRERNHPDGTPQLHRNLRVSVSEAQSSHLERDHATS